MRSGRMETVRQAACPMQRDALPACSRVRGSAAQELERLGGSTDTASMTYKGRAPEVEWAMLSTASEAVDGGARAIQRATSETVDVSDGLVSFSGGRRTVRGQLYRITPIESELRSQVQFYVEHAMQRDHQYVRTLYGRVSPVLQKDYDYFWESPFLQEHGLDTQKRRRIEEQQKNMVVKTFMRAQVTQDTDDVNGYLERVKEVMNWQDESNSKNVIKAVSRVVQSYELDAVRNVISVLATKQLRRPNAEAHLCRILESRDVSVSANGIEPVAHTLRRNPILSDLFVGVVATELILAAVCGGAASVSIHVSRLKHAARDNAIIQLLDALEATHASQIPVDTVGLPLMKVNCNLFISKGVLVVTGSSSTAKYILDITEEDGSASVADLTGVRTINLTGDIVREESDRDLEPHASLPAVQRKQERRRDALAIDPLL